MPVPAEVPSCWLVCFNVDDVDASYAAALGAGATEMLPPLGFPGARLAVLGDPEGAACGPLKRTA